MQKAQLPDVQYRMGVLRQSQGPDLRALKAAIRRLTASENSSLFEVLRSGPLPDSQQGYADVYKRGMLELKRFLDGQLETEV